MRALRSLLLGLGSTAIWPAYLLLTAYAARQAPWPRNYAIASATVLAYLALAAQIAGAARWLLRPGGWAEAHPGVPAPVARQLRAAVLALAPAGVLLLIPERLMADGLIAAGGRPVSAPATCRFLVLGFEIVVWGVAFRLVRGRSALMDWLATKDERTGWLDRHRRAAAVSILAAIALVIVLDARGYSFTARRLALGAGQTLGLIGLCWGLYRLLLRAIDLHAWRWIRPGHVPSHGRGVGVGHDEAQGYPGVEAVDASGQPDDLVPRLRRLAAYLVPIVGIFLGAWIWDVDPALFRFVGEQTLWAVDTKGQTTVYATVGDVTRALAFLLLTVAAWRHLSTLFSVAVFPRMPDDPGMRFAVVTLCRYATLGLGVLGALSSIHFGPDKIGMVLAALGVGLGFGLQEVVSNFVCGIILLLERPIRVGDIVTVSSMTGRVDRINIRATTIINGENQSIIVPNRGFITGDLVNWTLKDKVIRVSIRVKVAHGTDPDRVAELLLGAARDDADVLRNPVPAALMEDFTDAGPVFALHVHVPEPSLAGRVRHRLFGQIQRRFDEAGITIPVPVQELHVKSWRDVQRPPHDASSTAFPRLDTPRPTPPAPRLADRPAASPAPVEDCHRGVDE